MQKARENWTRYVDFAKHFEEWNARKSAELKEAREKKEIQERKEKEEKEKVSETNALLFY